MLTCFPLFNAIFRKHAFIERQDRLHESQIEGSIWSTRNKIKCASLKPCMNAPNANNISSNWSLCVCHMNRHCHDVDHFLLL